jgi:heat shock protein HslJ
VRNLPALLVVSGVVRPGFTRPVALLAVGLLLTASGCGGNDEDDGDSLNGTEWTLVSGVDVPPDSAPTIAFDGKLATGFSACNHYGGEYEIDGDSIEIGGFDSTAMGCLRPELETAEETYRSVFDDVDGWVIEEGELILSSDGDEVLRFAAATDG